MKTLVAIMIAFLAIGSTASATPCEQMYYKCMGYGTPQGKCAKWRANAERTGSWAAYTVRGTRYGPYACETQSSIRALEERYKRTGQ